MIFGSRVGFSAELRFFSRAFIHARTRTSVARLPLRQLGFPAGVRQRVHIIIIYVCRVAHNTVSQLAAHAGAISVQGRHPDIGPNYKVLHGLAPHSITSLTRLSISSFLR